MRTLNKYRDKSLDFRLSPTYCNVDKGELLQPALMFNVVTVRSDLNCVTKE